MKLIKQINDEDLGLESQEMINPQLRYSARGIIKNSEGKVAVIFKAVKNEYKLPGGGIEGIENKIETFKREILEETGCEITDIKEIGYTEENKSKENFKQISYVFKANVQKDLKKLNLTKQEKDEETKVEWMSIEEAREKVKRSYDKLVASEYDNVYRSKFVVLRDLAIIDEYITKYN